MPSGYILLKSSKLRITEYIGEVLDFLGYLWQKAENQNVDDVAAYQVMAADTEREQEAREWCNAYFGPKWNGAVFGGLNLNLR